MSGLRSQMRYLNPYQIHKLLINEYVLNRSGDTAKLKRDTSRDRNDYHVIKENHKFLWDDDDQTDSWEQQFARRYYDKLFKEYCIGDLSLYKENKIALRWRVEKEVISGKGQFNCGNKRCLQEDGLRTWEVNFGYSEHGEKKNALVKIRLCGECSKKLNYHSKKREVKRLRKSKHNRSKEKYDEQACSSADATISDDTVEKTVGEKTGLNKDNMDEENRDEKLEEKHDSESPWDSHKPIECKTREEEMDEYLQDLLF